MKNPIHHIIPRYKCKELGIDPDFLENLVEVTREDHALIHWGYKCNDLEPLFKYITPAQWIIDLIPIGDNRDVGAAVLIARGEIDGIDMSGENNPSYKHGDYAGLKADGWLNWPEEKKERRRALQRTPEYLANLRKPERLARRKKYDKAYNQTPERKAYRKEYEQTPERKAYKKKYNQTRNYGAERYAKKKTETQGEGTLEAFL